MILVTGAGGNVGRPLVASLLRAGAAVRAVTRDPARAGIHGAEVVVGDPARPRTLRAAFAGVSAVFVNPRAVGAAVGDLLDLARAAGVRRAVVLSAVNADDDPARQPSRWRGDRNREVEEAVTGWGGEWVSLRPSVFTSNTLGMWGAQLRRGDVVRGPYGMASAAPVDERDIAAVAAAALLGADLAGRRLPLTGPAALTQHDMVAAIAAATGRPLRYQEIDPARAREVLTGGGFPAGFADAYLAMQRAATARPATVHPHVPDILGRPALDYPRWARDNAAALAATPRGAVR